MGGSLAPVITRVGYRGLGVSASGQPAGFTGA
jgi:hypothetical protein